VRIPCDDLDFQRRQNLRAVVADAAEAEELARPSLGADAADAWLAESLFSGPERLVERA